MWVVKLGGSLLGTPQLQEWLDMLAQQSDGRVVIVPGGGVFADAVRSAQPAAGFDDAVAHHMALLAMEQFGLVLRAMQPKLVMAGSELEIAERSWQHRAIVWMPSQMVLADEEVPQNWEVTSDSLAAWLAWKIGADGLVLVKHADLVGEAINWQQLQAAQFLDPAFAAFASRLSCPIHVLGKTEHIRLATALSGDSMPTRAT